MMTLLVRVALVLSLFLGTASSVNSNELLTMRISKLDRAFVIVRLSVEADADNRVLALTAEGPGYYRSSQIQLDGERAPRTTVFELRGLPADVYEVTGILVGKKGPRAKVLQLVRVLPKPLKAPKAR